jgi:hypothetical protein
MFVEPPLFALSLPPSREVVRSAAQTALLKSETIANSQLHIIRITIEIPYTSICSSRSDASYILQFLADFAVMMGCTTSICEVPTNVNS